MKESLCRDDFFIKNNSGKGEKYVNKKKYGKESD